MKPEGFYQVIGLRRYDHLYNFSPPLNKRWTNSETEHKKRQERIFSKWKIRRALVKDRDREKDTPHQTRLSHRKHHHKDLVIDYVKVKSIDIIQELYNLMDRGYVMRSVA